MTSALDLDRFLVELSLRRERLLGLVAPADADTDLFAEVMELSEQLIVAEEELRVQQDQLDSARQTVMSLLQERDRVFRQASRAYVISDSRGVVVHATQAIEQLIRQPAIRLVPRPIATWFEASDRRVVRAMISGAVATADPQYARRLTVKTADAERVVVDLTVETMRDSADGRTLLRWELHPVPQQPALRLVVPAYRRPERSQQLVADFGTLASVLDQCLSAEDMYPAIVEAALQLVHDGGHVGLSVVSSRGTLEAVAWSSPIARELDAAQLAAKAGPLAEALNGPRPVGVQNVSLGSPDDAEPESEDVIVIAVPLVSGRRRLGVLTLYPDGLGFDEAEVEMAATALAALVSAALARAVEVGKLQAAMLSRQLIGEAVGVLMERHRVTPEVAFAELSRCSQEANVKVRDIAQIVVETGQSPSEIDRR